MSNGSIQPNTDDQVPHRVERFVEEATQSFESASVAVGPNALNIGREDDLSVVELKKRIPNLSVHSIACPWSNVTNLEQFIVSYRPTGSATGTDMQCSHFVAANFAFQCALGRGTILPMMDFVCDHRFVRPGFTTILAVTHLKRTPQKRVLNEHAVRFCLHEPWEQQPVYDLSYLSEFVAIAVHQACPAMELDLLHREEFVGSGGEEMFFASYRIKKPSWAAEYPSARSQIRQNEDGTFAIGELPLPGGWSTMATVEE